MPVLRTRILAVSPAKSNAASSGSGAMWAICPGMSAPSPSTSRWPKVRWSVNRRSGPRSVKLKRTRTCGESGTSGGTTSSWPLMPRWASIASSPTGSQRYLPRRLAASKVRPASRAAKSPGPPSCRRTARECKTATVSMRLPTTNFSSPRLITSTSGSSGTGQAWGSPESRLARPSLIAVHAASAACCSASFLDRPSPSP